MILWSFIQKVSCLILVITLFSTFLYGQWVNNEGIDSEIRYRWDAAANDWSAEDRTDYLRDSSGNAIEETLYYWEPAMFEWIPERLYKRTYDSIGNIISRDRFNWDNLAKEWNPSITECFFDDWFGRMYCYDFSRTEYTYDSAGNITEWMEYSWDPELGSYIDAKSYISEFDENGNEISSSYFKWDTIGNEWILESQYLSFFDSAGNNIISIQLKFDLLTGVPIEGERYITAYDSSGNRIKSTSFSRDAYSSGWAPSSHEELYYDSLGNEISQITYTWDTYKNGWVKDWEADFRYDTLGLLMEESFCGYWQRNSSSECDYSSRYTYAYDVDGNLIENISYEMSFPSGDLNPYYRVEYVYDSTGILVEETTSRWETVNWDDPYELGSWIVYYNRVSVFDSAGNKIEESYMDLYDPYEPYGWKTVWSWSYDLLGDQVISVDENCREGSVLAPIVTGSRYRDEDLLMELSSSYDHKLFTLDTLESDFVLVVDSALDFERSPIHHLTLTAQFEGSSGIRKDSAIMTVHVRNVNDNAPVLQDTTIEIPEDIHQSKILCFIQAIDADGNLDTLKYHISAGNTSGIFSCDQNGIIRLERFDSIDYEKQEIYPLTVQVTDGKYRSEGMVNIKVLDLDETYIGSQYTRDQVGIFPNPVKDILYLKVPAELLSGMETTVTNLSGNILYQQSGSVESIDLTSVPEGLYFITIRTRSFVTIKKIVKF